MKKRVLLNVIKKCGKVFIPLAWRPYIKERIRKVLLIDERNMRRHIKNEINLLERKPLVSIIMPVFDDSLYSLKKTIQSVKNQLYENWELCIIGSCSTNKKTVRLLSRINHSKVKVKLLDQSTSISNVLNEAILISSGEFIALLEVGDELTNDALLEVVKKINIADSDFIYTDEDCVNKEDEYCQPHYKPDFSIDLILSCNYFSRFSVIKKSIVDEVGKFEDGYDRFYDYDLFLKCIEKTSKIDHIPKILYHKKLVEEEPKDHIHVDSVVSLAGMKVLENYLVRNNIKGEVISGTYKDSFRVKRALNESPLVSIIIPFKDKPELLKVCIDSVLEKSTYQNFEIIGVSNNSEGSEIFELMKAYEAKDSRVKFYEYNVPFNYSKINNYCLSLSKGKHIVLLNNDIEIITPDWIEAMLEYSERPDVGAVGAKLYYPDGTIQHAGVIVGLGGVAGHSHKHYKRDDHGYYGRINLVQNLSAVTAACLMVKKELFLLINGLEEEHLKVAFNDVDFCLRLRELNYLNVYTPYCEAFHHESISRGVEDNEEKVKRFNGEMDYIKSRHKDFLKKGDPYYNRNLTLHAEDFSIGI